MTDSLILAGRPTGDSQCRTLGASSQHRRLGLRDRWRRGRRGPVRHFDPGHVEGALVGVLAGEAFAYQPGPLPQAGSLSVALVQLCGAYAVPGSSTPLEVARRHAGVAGPAWLVPVAVVHRDPSDVAVEVRALATAAEMPARAVWLCVTYVEDLITAPMSFPSATTPPRLCGRSADDAVAAGRWAAAFPGCFQQLLDVLTAIRAAPSVFAAAGAAWGTVHGVTAIPYHHRDGVLDRLAWGLARGVLRVRSAGGASDAGKAS